MSNERLSNLFGAISQSAGSLVSLTLQQQMEEARAAREENLARLDREFRSQEAEADRAQQLKIEGERTEREQAQAEVEKKRYEESAETQRRQHAESIGLQREQLTASRIDRIERALQSSNDNYDRQVAKLEAEKRKLMPEFDLSGAGGADAKAADQLGASMGQPSRMAAIDQELEQIKVNRANTNFVQIKRLRDAGHEGYAGMSDQEIAQMTGVVKLEPPGGHVGDPATAGPPKPDSAMAGAPPKGSSIAPPKENLFVGPPAPAEAAPAAQAAAPNLFSQPADPLEGVAFKPSAGEQVAGAARAVGSAIKSTMGETQFSAEDELRHFQSGATREFPQLAAVRKALGERGFAIWLAQHGLTREEYDRLNEALGPISSDSMFGAAKK